MDAAVLKKVSDQLPLKGQTENESADGGNELLRQLVEKLNREYKTRNVALDFFIDEETDTMVIKVVDQDTDEVIRQVPPDEVLAIKRNIRSMIGTLFDSQA
jgi:flagellar protein FlaG